MTPAADAARRALAHLDVDDNPATLKGKSRDFYWYSPVLKDRLDGVMAEFAVAPRSEAEVAEVLAVCHAHGCPLTVRGAGTGNYGQAMPLAGGCVLHLKHLARVREIAPGRIVAEPGCLLKDLDAAAREHSGQEIRMFSSTWSTATVGGFVAGGSGGVGSVRWGSLRDLGNILRLRVLTMEAEPRAIEVTGDDIPRVAHAYGTNGVITEVEMPLAPAYDWVDAIVGFDDFMEAVRYSVALASEDGILIKLASPIEAPIPQDFFPRMAPHVAPGWHLVMLMVAPHALGPWETFTARWRAETVYRSDTSGWERGPGPIFEYTWNHTTLRALKVDPAITYLQVRFWGEDCVDKVAAVRDRYRPEVLQHLEVVREQGRVRLAGLPLVRFTTEARLEEIVAGHEALGCEIYNPHRYTLEEGGRQTVDAAQVAFKREADPAGLLNPGKMIGWEDADWDYSAMYAYPGLRRAG